MKKKITFGMTVACLIDKYPEDSAAVATVQATNDAEVRAGHQTRTGRLGVDASMISIPAHFHYLNALDPTFRTSAGKSDIYSAPCFSEAECGLGEIYANANSLSATATSGGRVLRHRLWMLQCRT